MTLDAEICCLVSKVFDEFGNISTKDLQSK